jgi:hypothetical protein
MLALAGFALLSHHLAGLTHGLQLAAIREQTDRHDTHTDDRQWIVLEELKAHNFVA